MGREREPVVLFGLEKFEMSNRQASRDVEWIVGYMSLKHRGKIWAAD